MSRDQNAGRSRKIKTEIGMQDDVKIQRLIIVHLKGWNSSNISEQALQIKTLFRNKLRADWSQVMLTIFPSRIGLLSKYTKIKIYKNIVLSVTLYGCETWSLRLSEERRLRVFENGVLRRILGPRWER